MAMNVNDDNGNLIMVHDFQNAEKANGTVESSHKNGIYSIMRNFIKFS